jgi:hypothetical protein
VEIETRYALPILLEPASDKFNNDMSNLR